MVTYHNTLDSIALKMASALAVEADCCFLIPNKSRQCRSKSFCRLMDKKLGKV